MAELATGVRDGGGDGGREQGETRSRGVGLISASNHLYTARKVCEHASYDLDLLLSSARLTFCCRQGELPIRSEFVSLFPSHLSSKYFPQAAQITYASSQAESTCHARITRRLFSFFPLLPSRRFRTCLHRDSDLLFCLNFRFSWLLTTTQQHTSISRLLSSLHLSPDPCRKHRQPTVRLRSLQSRKLPPRSPSRRPTSSRSSRTSAGELPFLALSPPAHLSPLKCDLLLPLSPLCFPSPLRSRFILNLPPSESSSVPRICFQVEQAFWFYEDWVRDLNPSLPSYTLKRFSEIFFKVCPLLSQWSDEHERMFLEFMRYKSRVPVCGAIMINEAWDKVSPGRKAGGERERKEG
jgi:hypothetical protein